MIENRLLLFAVSVLLFSTSRFAYGLEPNWSENINIRTVCENVKAGEEAYVMSATGPTIVYSISNVDSVNFEMCPDNGASTGRVCAKEDLNRETVASYEVTEVAADADNVNDKIQRTINVNLQDENDNEPIFQGLPYIFYLHEGSEAGTVAGQVDATDADQQFASNVDMFLQEDRGVLELTSNTAVPTNVVITETLDYEKSPIYIGVLTAKDRGDVSVECGDLKSLSAETAVYLNVYDGPDTPPEFTSRQYSGSVKENAADSTELLTVEANDGDYGLRWAIKYTLSNYDDIFSIGEDSGILTVRDGSKIDRESDGVSDGFYTLNVTATEIKPENYSVPQFDHFPGPQSSSVIVTIFVEDINDNGPVFYTDSTYQIPTSKYNITISESTRGTIPDLLIYVKDNDQRENAEFKLEIIGDDGRYFELSSVTVISEASLSLKVKSDEELDYETKSNLNFEISATDDDAGAGIMSRIQMLITLTDENDNSPNFITTNVEVDIPEHSETDYPVTTIKAEDADSGENAEIQYSLQPENSGFRIDGDTGEVFVAPGSSLDRETRAQYFLTVIATDTGGLINTTQLTVTLTDINDQTPEFLQTQYIINWEENDDNPDPLEVEALDSDDAATNNSEMEIFFADPEVSSSFQIIADSDGSGGVIRASITPTVPLDAEVLPGACSNGIIEFELEVSVRDKGSPSKSSNATITIFLRGVNDHAPIFNDSVYNGSVNEGSEQGTAVAKVFASDGDKCETNNEITFAVDNDFADSFLMGLSEDGESVLQVRRPLDRDLDGFYDVIVYAVDSGRPQMSSSATVRVTVLDVNDKDPYFVDESQLEITVNENAKIDQVIGSVFADDTDINSNLSFSIIGFRCIDENDVAVGDSICTGWFSISSKDQVGNISVSSELDRETVETVVLTVQVEDMNADTDREQISTTTVTVLISDYNDNAPDITAPDKPFAVIEQLSVGTVIGRLSASDLDKDNTVTFFVDSPFVNITADGEITVNGVIDREGVPGSNFSAFINARDNGEPSMTSQIEVKFDVVDANDHDPSFGNLTSFTCEIKENEAPLTPVCTITATDEDIGDNALLTYSIQTADAPFRVNSTSGKISSDIEFNQEDINSYQFKFRARDTAGDLARESEVDVIVNILDLDDNEPTYEGFSPQEIAITEENDENFNMGTVQEAFDADTEENRKNSYFLLYDEDADLSDVFSLDRTTRNLTAIPTLDREKNSSYTLYVLTTRNDSIASTNYQDYVGNFSSEILTVNVVVEDINDNAPVFERASDTTDLLYATSYGENNIVTIVTATDPDAGENAILTYSILSERYYRPGSTVAAQVEGEYFAIDSGNGQVKTTAISFETEIAVGGLFKLVIEVMDGGDLSDQMNLDIKIFDETETVILESRYSEEELEASRDQIEIDLENALDADVVIDKIVPKEVQNQAARATTDETQITEIHFHATEWNSTRLIPAEEIAAELDSNQNNDLLITWAIVSIGTSEVDTGPTISETDLLKAILAVVSAVLLLFLLVLAIAFVCMRRSYKRKIKAAEAGQETALAVEEQRVPKMSVNIPNTNQNAVGENMLYLESQKNTISMDAWQKLAESSDDNNSIDDNAVDSQDSAISEGRQASFNGDDLDDVEIDFPADDLSNLQNALNRRGNDMVFENNYTGMDDTTAM